MAGGHKIRDWIFRRARNTAALLFEERGEPSADRLRS